MSTINILVMILEFVISLGILIFIHELGHFLFSVRFGVKRRSVQT